MEEKYYSQKLKKQHSTRLDVLLYAHDGRGLGHASRTIAIGMALRRLYPELRVLFVSGTNMSQSLIGQATLDWIKLPSYASKVVDGVSRGIDGPANFYKSVLAQHRSTMLAQIIASFQPKCVLVDHSPLGKREELEEALEISKSFDTLWVLGLRAVMGNPPGFWSARSRQVVEDYYHRLFWYGDDAVLGPQHKAKIEAHFHTPPVEMGYVSRLYEAGYLLEHSADSITGTISLPWLSEASKGFVLSLKKALLERAGSEMWKIFVHRQSLSELQDLFAELANVQIYPVGEEYIQAIFHSKMAIVYGGYNSLMDVAAAGIPAIIVKREMKDLEQDEHIQQLLNHDADSLVMVEESGADAASLNQAITRLLKRGASKTTFNIKGSSQAAKTLIGLLGMAPD